MPPAGGDKRGRKKEPKKKNAPGPKPPKASTDREAEDSKDEDEHPFALGAMLLCEWGLEKSRRLCQIIERAQDSEDASLYNYYVHFLDYNRRMDEWVTPNRILALPSEAARLAKDHARGHHGKEDTEADEDKGSRRKKRRNGEEEEEEEEDKPMGHTVVADMEHDEHEGIDEASLKEHEEVTKVKNVRTIELGRHVMECWYFSPFPKEYYPNGFVDRLYFCEFSLRYFAHKSELARYQARGVDRHPPGNEIYRKDGLSMFEVDGAENKEYCESLCYMAKLFLDHKTLYYEVDPFLFYVMCEYDERGFHPTGYFSKEKYSDVGYNLACKNWQPFNFYLQIGSDVGYNLSIFTFALPKQVSSPSPATSARATGAFSSPSRTSCQKKSPKWGPQRSPCRTWARSGTEAIGRQRCSWSSRSTRARPSA